MIPASRSGTIRPIQQAPTAGLRTESGWPAATTGAAGLTPAASILRHAREGPRLAEVPDDEAACHPNRHRPDQERPSRGTRPGLATTARAIRRPTVDRLATDVRMG